MQAYTLPKNQGFPDLALTQLTTFLPTKITPNNSREVYSNRVHN
jgi:hypothetical protein